MHAQVDRKKLKTDKQYTPSWQSAASAGAAEEYEPPSSALEKKIQKVWQEVLGQEKISVAADFFQIGGNSLRVSNNCWSCTSSDATAAGSCCDQRRGGRGCLGRTAIACCWHLPEGYHRCIEFASITTCWVTIRTSMVFNNTQ